MSKLLEDLIKRELRMLENPKYKDPIELIKQLEKEKKALTERIKGLRKQESNRQESIQELKSLLDGSDTNAN